MTRLFKEMLIIALTVVAGIYMLNPTLGVFELIPDVTPIIGNLDEAGATLIILNSLRYYGVNLDRLFGTRTPRLPDNRR